MTARLNLENKRFGKLVALHPHGKRGTNILWLCRCDCGKETIVAASILNIGKSSQCVTCAQFNNLYALKHGMSRSPEYRAHRAMIDRCYSPAVEAYPDYGGRGIAVCDRWRGPEGFENFLADLGLRPEKMELDRINVNGNYEPSNCRWTTRSQQSKNRRKFTALTNYPTPEVFNELSRRCVGVVA